MVTLGKATAKKIAQTAKIDSGEVYRQIEALHKNNLLEKIVDFPSSYKPLALSNVLEILIEKENRKNIEIQERANALLKKEPQIDLEKEEYKISIIPKNEYLSQYIKRAFERTEKEWFWYTQIERVPIVINNYYDAYEKALNRGISWHTIAEVNNPTNQAIKFIKIFCEKNPNFKIRFIKPNLLTTFALRDGVELDYFLETTNRLLDSNALYTNNFKLTKLIVEYFELIWDTADKEYPKTH